MQFWRAGLATYPLSTTQLQDVLLIVSGWRLDPKDFGWSLARTRARQVGPGHEDVTVDKLTHTPTGYSFQFDFDTRMRHVAYLRPGKDTPESNAVSGTWEEQRALVNAWASYVEREFTTPDVWSMVGEGELGALPSGVANTLFTEEEQKRIEAVLRAALESAQQTQELNDEHKRVLEEKVDFLLEASRQVGRIHWRSLLIGVLAEAVIEDVLPRGFVRQLVMLTMRGLSAVFGGPDFGELPRPGP